MLTAMPGEQKRARITILPIHRSQVCIAIYVAFRFRFYINWYDIRSLEPVVSGFYNQRLLMKKLSSFSPCPVHHDPSVFQTFPILHDGG
jgi:hypothetical protein